MTHERRKDTLDMNGRIVALEVGFTNHMEQTRKLVIGQEQCNQKLDKILITMAEQRGAGKAIKVIWGIAMTAVGFMGGLLGGAARHM